jgi:hypothetical protein
MNAGTLIAAALLATLAGFAPIATAEPPGTPSTAAADTARQIEPLWSELVALVPERPWSPIQWTRGIYLSTQIFRFGAQGVPYMNAQFSGAKGPTVAFLAGVYVTLYGTGEDLTRIRSALETDRTKHSWLKAAFGDPAALSNTMEGGEEWSPALRCLPAPGGCRKLAMSCLQSSDPLVRRAGLYWGFWVPDATYWSAVRQCIKSDSDSLNRRFAAFLLRKADDD